MCSNIIERKISAVVGALVADAAALPIHWVYDTSKLDAALQDVDDVGFREPSINPFYRLPVGRQTCYGDQSFVVLKSLVEKRGLEPSHLKTATYEAFGPDSEYEEKTNAGYKEKGDIVGSKKYPIHSPWRHFSLKDFLKNFDANKECTGSETDEQIDCMVRIVPVVALYAGHPDLLNMVEEVIQQTQNTDTAVAAGCAAARILEHFILHGNCDDAVEKVTKELENPTRVNPHDLDRSIVGFLREVTSRKAKPHVETAREIRIS